MSEKEVLPAKAARPVPIVVLSSALLLLIIAVPGVLLFTGDGQFQVGNWGARWLPSNHPWAGKAPGIKTMSEGFSAALGGENNSNGTRMTIPPGLVHTELKQWGRLQWWHLRVVGKPGAYQQNEVMALQRQIETKSLQRALAARQHGATP